MNQEVGKHLNIKVHIQVTEVETGKFIDSDAVDITLPHHEILEWFTNYGRAVCSVFCAKQNVGIRITGPVGAKITQIKALRQISVQFSANGVCGLREAKDAIELVNYGPQMIIKGLSNAFVAQIEEIAQSCGATVEIMPTSLSMQASISPNVIVLNAKSE